MRHPLLLSLILLAFTLGYAAVALSVSADVSIFERQLGDAVRDDSPQLRLYIEVLAIDAVNDSMRLRASPSPNGALEGSRRGVADRDLQVHLAIDGQVHVLAFRAREAMAPGTFDVDLNGGTVAVYPFDRFHAGLRATVQEAGGAPVKLHVTVWEGLAGWMLEASPVDSGGGEQVQMRFDIRRSAATRLLVIGVYGVMVLIAIAALTIASVIFLRRRPAESTLTGALASMVFTLPALRYTLPGAPPVGVFADLLVFFWAELAVTLALMLFIATWAATRGK